MKKRFKGFYLIILSLFAGLMNVPISFANSTPENHLLLSPVSDTTAIQYIQPEIITSPSVYDSLHLNLKGLSKEAFEYAKEGFDKLVENGKLRNSSIISVLDFSKASNQKRLFIIDLKNYKVLFNTFVAHGRNTGREMATSFSNQNESFKSSPGFYITRETYIGKNGFSLKLEGVEKGINDNAYERGIVMHGADYVSEHVAKAQGWVGRSLGCPAVPVQLNVPIINTIKNGTCLFIYSPGYVDRSVLLN